MITLTIINVPFEALPSPKSTIVGPQGGSVGRSEEANIFQIPDPSVSRHHFKILYTQGKYCLQDTSSNGVFLNGDALPVGNGNIVPINPGDTIKIGRTELRVDSYGAVESDLMGDEPLPGFGEISTSPDAPKADAKKNHDLKNAFKNDLWETPDSALPDNTQMSGTIPSDLGLNQLLEGPSDLPNLSEPSGLIDQFLGYSGPAHSPTPAGEILDMLSIAPSKHGDFIPEDFDLPRMSAHRHEKISHQRIDELLMPSGNTSAKPAIPLGENTFLAAMLSEAPVVRASPPQATPSTRKRDEPPSHTAAPPPPVAKKHQEGLSKWIHTVEGPARSLKIKRQDPPVSGLNGALTPLLGDAANQLTEEQCLATISELASSMRNVVTGLSESLQSRWVFKQAMHLSMTMIQRAENNPMKFSPTPETAVQTMFIHRPQGYQTAPVAMSDSIQELQKHQAAIIAAIKPAMMETIYELFSVQAIEKHADQQSSNFVSFGRKGKLWDSYATRTNALLGEKQSELETLLMKKIGAHYSRLTKDLN